MQQPTIPFVGESHLTNRDLQDLSRFARLPEGRVLLDWLGKRLAEADRQLRIARGTEDVFRAQGAALELQQQIEVISGAEKRLNQLGAGSKRPVTWHDQPQEPQALSPRGNRL